MKQLSTKEKKIRKLKKELKSLRNKLTGYDLIWFNSLTKERQFDFLIEWKREKWNKKNIESPIKKDFFSHYRRKIITFKVYPASLKKFTKECRSKMKYKPSISKYRDSFIDSLLG